MGRLQCALWAAAGLLLADSALALTNPGPFVLSSTFADPRTIYWNGMYYSFATKNPQAGIPEPVRNVPAAYSKSFSSGWSYSNVDVLPNPGPWANATGHVWDTAVYPFSDDHFVMYYAAAHKSGPLCIGVAVSQTILGTYTPTDEALICDYPSGGINQAAVPFMYKGTPYIVHKKGVYSSSALHIQQLTPDGTGVVGKNYQLLHTNGTGGKGTVEGPAMTFNPNNDDYPILLYAAGNFANPSYNIQYAIPPTNQLIPDNGAQYIVKGQLLKTETINGANIIGPGGPTFPRGMDAPRQLSFMADRNNTPVGRSLRTANITYGADNTLSIPRE